MPKSGGTIYAIGAQGTALVKIGFTRLPVAARLRALQTGQPFSLHIIAAQPVEAEVQRIEKQVHEFLGEERRRGEWFEVPMDMATLESLIVRAITVLTAQGEPPPRASRADGSTMLGQWIRQARINKGWKQNELVIATGLSQKYLSEIECGKVDPRFSIVQKIAHVLDMSLDSVPQEDLHAR